VGAVAGRSPPGRGWALTQTGAQRPLISTKSNHRSMGGLVSVCDNVDVATLRYSTAMELRVCVIASTDGLDDPRSIIDVPAHGAALYTADDDDAGCRRRRGGFAWELLRVVSALRSALVERDVCRKQLIDGVRHTVGYLERRPRATDD
jgi:hypothetical protein